MIFPLMEPIFTITPKLVWVGKGVRFIDVVYSVIQNTVVPVIVTADYIEHKNDHVTDDVT